MPLAGSRHHSQSAHQNPAFVGDVVGDSSAGSDAVPRSVGATQSPAQSLVPLTVPTSLQPTGSFDFGRRDSLLGEVCAKAAAETLIAMSRGRIIVCLSLPVYCRSRGLAGIAMIPPIRHGGREAPTMTAQKSTKLVKSKPLVKIIHQPRAFEPAMSWKL
jgi:hypothetical protein